MKMGGVEALSIVRFAMSREMSNKLMRWTRVGGGAALPVVLISPSFFLPP